MVNSSGPKPIKKKKSKKLSASRNKRKTPAAQLKELQKSLPEDVRISRVKGIGRPSVYKPEYCMLLINHMKEGMNFETFAAKLEYMTAGRLYEWVEKHPEFRDAKKIGEMLAYDFWLRMGRSGAAGKIKGFQTAPWIFIMKNLFKWQDRHEVKTEHREIKEVVHTVEIGVDGDISQIKNVITA